MVAWWRILIACVCLILSGTFSGLTLGLMSLGVMDLRVLTESGTEREKHFAKKILPVRKHGNFLLCTLLIGNTAVNSALAIVTSDIFGGVAGFLSSTFAILYLGEIIPQAVCHRFGLVIGAYAIPLVKLFMLLTSILSYPTSKLLDWLLGNEPTTRYNKSQLRSLLSIHGNQPPGSGHLSDDADPDLENGQGTYAAKEETRGHREITPHDDVLTKPPPLVSNVPKAQSTPQLPVQNLKVEHSNSTLKSTNESSHTKPFFHLPASLRRSRRKNGSLRKQDSAGTDKNKDKKNRNGGNGDDVSALLTRDELAIFGGAFEFRDKNVSQVMTHIDKVFMLDASLSLSFNVMLIIFQSGHSRIPVYENDRSNVIGVLFAKDLILLDPEDAVPLKSILHFFNRLVVAVYDDLPLFDMLNIFKKGGGHLAVVQKVINDDETDPRLETLGVATLEDLIEELIGEDIVDETDVYTDNVSRKPVRRVRSIDTELLKMFDPLRNEQRLTEKEVLVVASYLAHNTHEFSETCVRYKILRETLINCPIEEYFDDDRQNTTTQANGSATGTSTGGTLPSVLLSPVTGSFCPVSNTGTLEHIIQSQQKQLQLAAQQSNLRKLIGPKSNGGSSSSSVDEDSIYIYKRGVPSFNAYLILNGRVEITAGNDEFRSEAGPWTLLGVHALVDDLYAPDFTARVLEKPARLLRLSRKFYRLMQQYSGEGIIVNDISSSNSFNATAKSKLRVNPHTLEQTTPEMAANNNIIPPQKKVIIDVPIASPKAADHSNHVVVLSAEKQQAAQNNNNNNTTPSSSSSYIRRVSASTNKGRELKWSERSPTDESSDNKAPVESDILAAEILPNEVGDS